MRVLLVAAVLLAASAPGCMWFGGPAGVQPQDFIQAGTYTNWIIEVDYAQGQQPDSTLLSTLDTTLQNIVAQGKNVEVRLSSTALAASDRTWTVEALVELDRSTLNFQTASNTIVSHLIFLDGHAEADDADSKVLGVSIKGGLDHGLVAIFYKTLKDACTLPCLDSQEPAMLRAVVIHEFGHELGLVNNGIPMQTDHEDDAHPGHSTNSASVMYWAVESIPVAGLIDEPSSQFDSNDKADLRAAGGR